MCDAVRPLADYSSPSLSLHAAIAATDNEQPSEYPKRCDLRKDIYRPLPAVSISPESAASADPTAICNEALTSLFDALSSGDVDKVKETFYTDQSYWRDQLALTYHFRTFNDRDVISEAMVERTRINKLGKVTVLPGTARLLPAGPPLVSSPLYRRMPTCFTLTSSISDLDRLLLHFRDFESSSCLWWHGAASST